MGKKIIEVVSNQKYCMATFFKGLNASWTGERKKMKDSNHEPLKLVMNIFSLSRAFVQLHRCDGSYLKLPCSGLKAAPMGKFSGKDSLRRDRNNTGHNKI